MKSEIEGVNKYVQGSIWHWANRGIQRDSVQYGERPVLVISNDAFNKRSSVVNCVSVTTMLKESPVHEPIYLVKHSHIQCEQIHTIPKEELTEFFGNVPNSTLSNVKSKLRIQFAMNEDRSAELLLEIRKNIDMVNKKLSWKSSDHEDIVSMKALLENLHEITKKETLPDLKEARTILDIMFESAGKNSNAYGASDDFRKLFIDLSRALDVLPDRIVTAINNAGKTEQLGQAADNTKVLPKPLSPAKNANLNKPSQNIAANNAKNAFAPLTPAKEATKSPSESSGISELSQESKQRRRYTDEDRREIADEQNSIQDIMSKYGFETKKAAYAARTYARKFFDKAQ
jgi:mRNA-degrading endonuclease toxin of MazEF toxin-antitoxin module